MAELKYKNITEKIIGASFEVHKFLGNGFQEVIYQRALAWEMKQKDLEFAREIEQEIYYKDLPEPIGRRRADFTVGITDLHGLTDCTDFSLAFLLFIDYFLDFHPCHPLILLIRDPDI